VVMPRGEVAAASTDAIAHLLNRATYGPTAALVDEVRRVGTTAWIDAQLAADPAADAALEQRLAVYPTLNMSTAELLASYPEQEAGMRDPATSPARIRAELVAARIVRGVHATAQLREVLVDFWANHFNVFGSEGPTRWTITAYERDTIRPYVLGRFEDLLRATAQSPAMLYYLDNYVSVASGTRGDGSGINENYARELMELHTLGVHGGYTQDDVVGVANTLTGWTITAPRSGTIDFQYVPRFHDPSAQTVLGSTIGRGQLDQGTAVLHALATHPSTAAFVARKLVERFVNDDPPAALVEKVEATFQSTEGDLSAVMRTLLTSRQFSSTRNRAAKVKAPLEFVISALRAVGADVTNGWPAARFVGLLGQSIYEAVPPTGWSELAPAVVSASGMLSRFDAAQRLTTGTVEGTTVDTTQWSGVGTGRSGATKLLSSILFRRSSKATRLAIQHAAEANADPTLLAALVLSSPEFQQQ
jgi:uncharacterized protein (DUF1800 family)